MIGLLWRQRSELLLTDDGNASYAVILTVTQQHLRQQRVKVTSLVSSMANDAVVTWRTDRPLVTFSAACCAVESAQRLLT